MIYYLKTIIVQSIDLNHDTPAKTNRLNMLFLAKAQEIDKEFHSKLSTNSNTIAYKTQIHLFKHNAICFKYSKNN